MYGVEEREKVYQESASQEPGDLEDCLLEEDVTMLSVALPTRPAVGPLPS